MVGVVGFAVGVLLGAAVGIAVVGVAVEGFAVGAQVGGAVGIDVGVAVEGFAVGVLLGVAVEGSAVGVLVGIAVGIAVGVLVGASVGAAVGARVLSNPNMIANWSKEALPIPVTGSHPTAAEKPDAQHTADEELGLEQHLLDPEVTSLNLFMEVLAYKVGFMNPIVGIP